MSALQDFASAAGALEGVVRTSIGPHGAQKIITSATGRVLVTKSGSAMLDAIEASSSAPMRVVLGAARTHGQMHGDGTASFVLMLAEALRRIDACLSSAALGEASRPRLVGALTHVAARWLPERALRELRNNVEAEAGDEASSQPGAGLAHTREKVRALLVTAFAGHFGGAFCALLARMIAECWVRSGGGTGLAPAELPVFGMPGAPLEKSLLVEGLVLEGPLASAHMAAELHAAPFAVLTFALGAPSAPLSAPAALSVASGEAYAELLARADAHADELVRELAAHGILLLLCTERPTAAAVASCVRHGMSALGSTDPTAARLICAATRSAPIREGGSVGALRDALRDAYPLPRASMRRADAAGRRLVVVNPQLPAELASPQDQRQQPQRQPQQQSSAALFTLLLRAPTDGLVLELKRTAERGWRLLQHAWLSRPSVAAAEGAQPLTVPAGGSFELSLAALALADAREVETTAAGSQEGGAARAARAFALRLVAESALAPIRALHGCLEVAGMERRWPVWRAAQLAACQPGRGGPRGAAHSAAGGWSTGGVEPFEARAALASAVCELVLQLLRVDAVVRARSVAGAASGWAPGLLGGAVGADGATAASGSLESDCSSSDDDSEGGAANRTMRRLKASEARQTRRPRWFA